MKTTQRILSISICVFLLMGLLMIPAAAAGTLVQGIGFVNATSLRLRSQPNTTSSVLATAASRECVVILDTVGDWYLVSYNLQQGYMHSDYLTVSSRENAELGYGEVTGSGVNLRSGPSTEDSVVARISKGETCYILGINNGWYKVICQNTIGYIRSDYLALTQFPYENRASAQSPRFFRGGKSLGVTPSAEALNNAPSSGSAVPETSSVSGSQIVAEARRYIGCPYRSGGASPSGFDCSGYVYYVLRQLGLSPARTPEGQYRQGTPVARSNLQPGDLVFFGSASGITHAGIYAGNGQFLHAPNSRSTVSYSSLTSGYWADTYYGAVRIA